MEVKDMEIIQADNVMVNDPAHKRMAFKPEYGHGSAFANGKYGSIDEATVPLIDLGFAQADATYDVVSASKGYFFRLQDHLDRFDASCEKFRLKNPYTQEQTVEILTRLLQLAGTKEAYIWFAVTRGHMPDGDARINPAAYENLFYAYVVPYVYIADDEKRTRGLDLMVSKKFIRIPAKSVDPTAKNFHWMDLKLSLFEAYDNGRDWSVLCDAEGYLTESPGANIFLIKDGVMLTPDNGCLEGITRKTTLELAKELEVPVRAERVHVSQLFEADEAFITSTAGGIMPVNSVDGTVLGGVDGPGKISTRIHNAYWTKRWDGWLGTPVDYSARSE
jgi:branched-chain amino acid aminotransferase